MGKRSRIKKKQRVESKKTDINKVAEVLKEHLGVKVPRYELEGAITNEEDPHRRTMMIMGLPGCAKANDAMKRSASKQVRKLLS